MKTKGCKNKKGVSRIISPYGYVDIFEPEHPMSRSNGYVFEHRKIAYDAGIITDRKMQVHHKNGIKTDNRVENLEAITCQDHTSLHWKGAKRKPFSKEHRESIRKNMKGNKNWAGNKDLIK